MTDDIAPALALETLRLLDQWLGSGKIEMQVYVPNPGTHSPWASINSICDLQTFFRAPVEFAAEAEGVSVAEYERWLAADGVPRCGATTVAGRRCRNRVSGWAPNAKEWLRLDGEYCAVHGGLPSEKI